ncbi:hypothetical protein BD413DRAFT_551165 [Trametes elegans]|nr:hypothetical protein BD413DRAFT_551165 [Trametes elegans]
MSLLELSHELLVAILSYLDYRDLQVCRTLNQAINKLIQSSIVLQYSMKLQLYGYQDNANSPLVIADKLRLLRQQETAWSRLDFEKEKSIRIPFNPSSIYDLTDGVLLLGESVSGIQSGADIVRWTRLPRLLSGEDPTSQASWEKIDVGAHIIDVGLAVEEHDLIVLATDRETDNHETEFQLRLIQLSNGLNHPLAAKPVIALAVIQAPPRTVAGNCSVCIEIIGDLMCFLFHYPAGFTTPPAMFEVYNWKTGQCLEIRGLDSPSYSTFTFLSPDIIALPNCAENTIELCRITATSIDTPPKQLATSCVLQLPSLGRGHSIAQVTCRSEPKMMNTNRYAPAFRSTEPFHLKPEDAVVIFNVMTHDNQGFHECLTLIVHAAALLRIFDSHTACAAAPGHPPGVPVASSSSQLPPHLHPEPSGLPAPVPTDASGPAPPPGPPRIAWAAWGPHICRWLEASFGASRWITTTCGQRYVTVEEDPIDDDSLRSTIVVYDFNPHNVRRLAAQHRKRRRVLRGRVLDAFDAPEAHLGLLGPVPGGVAPGAVGTAGVAGGAATEADPGTGATGATVGAGANVHPEAAAAAAVAAARMDHASLIPFTDPATRVIGQIQCATTELMAGYAMQYRIFDETVRTSLPFAQLSSYKTYAYGAVLLDRNLVIGVKLNDADDIKELVVHAIKRGS